MPEVVEALRFHRARHGHRMVLPSCRWLPGGWQTSPLVVLALTMSLVTNSSSQKFTPTQQRVCPGA